MIIREEAPADRDAIHAVVRAAFGQADEAVLVDQLRDAGDAVISLVAEDAGQIVGHVLLSKMNAPFPALAPVSVAPARHATGVGSALIRRAVDRAQTQGCAALFVLGDPAYYQRFGFDLAAAQGFTSPYAGEHFMVLTLSPLPTSRGRVDYALAFAELG